MSPKVSQKSNNIFCSMVSSPFICCAIIIAIICVFAIKTKHELVSKYEQGVQAYNENDFYQALSIFDSLRGWGESLVEITPEEYYELTLRQVIGQDSTIIVCPKCRTIID